MSPIDARFGIIIFGDKDCGKTSLVQNLVGNPFREEKISSAGTNFEVKSIMVSDKNVKLQIWDFGNEDRFRFLLPTYLMSARGGLFVYDITNYFSLAHIDDWMEVVRKEIRAGDQFPIIMVGGKADLEDQREVPAKEGMQIAKLKGLDGFIECSSKTGENVEKAFEALTRLMMLLRS